MPIRIVSFAAMVIIYSMVWYGACAFVAGGWDSTEWDPVVKAFIVWCTWVPAIGFFGFLCFRRDIE